MTIEVVYNIIEWFILFYKYFHNQITVSKCKCNSSVNHNHQEHTLKVFKYKNGKYLIINQTIHYNILTADARQVFRCLFSSHIALDSCTLRSAAPKYIQS